MTWVSNHEKREQNEQRKSALRVTGGFLLGTVVSSALAYGIFLTYGDSWTPGKPYSSELLMICSIAAAAICFVFFCFGATHLWWTMKERRKEREEDE